MKIVQRNLFLGVYYYYYYNDNNKNKEIIKIINLRECT